MNKDVAAVVAYKGEILLTATPESLQQPTLRSREEESQTIASSVVITMTTRLKIQRKCACLTAKAEGDFNTFLHRN